MAKWVKVGVAGSAIWIFLVYLLFNFVSSTGSRSDMQPLILGGCAVIWLVSFLFLRDEEKKK